MATSVVFQESPIGPRSEVIQTMISERTASQVAASEAVGARDESVSARDDALDANSAAQAAAISAEASKNAASFSASTAGVRAAAALASAIDAEAERALAEAARDSSFLGVNIFPSDAAGLAATSVGQQFQVVDVSGREIIRFRHDAGPVAVEIARYPTAEILDDLAGKADGASVDDASTGARVPLIAAGDDVVLYLDPAGALDGRPLGEPMRRSVLDGVVDLVDATGPVPVALVDGQAAVWLDSMGNLGANGMAATLRRAAVSGIVTVLPPEGGRVPLLLAGDRVLLWVGPDGLSGPGIIKGISEVAARAEFAPRASSGDLPASTDGRSLARARRKAAQVRAGASETLRVAMIGDSWTQGVAIPNAMQALLAGILGDCGRSWVHAATSGHWSGVTVTGSAGWTWLDANVTTGWPYGAAPDGQMGWTSTSTDTLTIVTPSCSEARIYTRRHGGTWRWRVDGGSWTTVTEATGGALTITTITGLAAAAHTIEIDTTGNAGVVAWCGMDTRTAGAKAELVKIGNGGLRGIDMQTYIAGAQDILADLAPDVVICILGTNDYIYADSTVASFGAALSALTATARAATPGVGLVFVAPALSPTTAVTPLIAYRDEAYARALALGAEYLGAYDLIAPYASDPALWSDSRHLNQTGGDVLSRLINHRLMGI